MEKITWRGTPGVGDFMWALNSAHNYSADRKLKVNLEFHWEHGEDYLHHPEDPETIIERLDYIHNFYHRKDDVVVSHVFNSTDRYTDWKFSDDVIYPEDSHKPRVITRQIPKARFWFESGSYSDEEGSDAPINDWTFRRDAYREIDTKKVVVWTPQFNAETPRSWKNFLTDSEWRDIIKLLRRAGMNIVELSYRTPVREAMYHISTCRLVFCYDGMWHYIARNFNRPMVVVSPEGITTYHNPQALKVSPFRDKPNNIFSLSKNISDFLGKPKRLTVEYERKVMRKLWAT
jgi:hypothetical protein